MGPGRDLLVVGPPGASLATALTAALEDHGWATRRTTAVPADVQRLAPAVMVVEDDEGVTRLPVPPHPTLGGVAVVGSARSLPLLLPLAGRGAGVLNQSAPFGTVLGWVERILTEGSAALDGRAQVPSLRRREAERGRLASLTDTERSVLHALAEGSTTGEIAAASHRSLHTLRSHVRGVRTKLGVPSQLAAAAVGWRADLDDAADDLAIFTTFGDAAEAGPGGP